MGRAQGLKRIFYLHDLDAHALVPQQEGSLDVRAVRPMQQRYNALGSGLYKIAPLNADGKRLLAGLVGIETQAQRSLEQLDKQSQD